MIEDKNICPPSCRENTVGLHIHSLLATLVSCSLRLHPCLQIRDIQEKSATVLITDRDSPCVSLEAILQGTHPALTLCQCSKYIVGVYKSPAQVIRILCEGLEHPGVLCPEGSWDQSPINSEGCLCVQRARIQVSSQTAGCKCVSRPWCGFPAGCRRFFSFSFQTIQQTNPTGVLHVLGQSLGYRKEDGSGWSLEMLTSSRLSGGCRER